MVRFNGLEHVLFHQNIGNNISGNLGLNALHGVKMAAAILCEFNQGDTEDNWSDPRLCCLAEPLAQKHIEMSCVLQVFPF